MSEEPNIPIVVLPVSRTKALTRAIAWGAPAVVCALVTVGMFGRINLAPSGLSNRLVEYCLALCTLPVAVGAAAFGVLATRWFLLAVWPGKLGVFAGPKELILRLGSFGTRRFDADRLDVKYPFELELDVSECGVEDFLPEEEQRATLVPRITFPGVKEPIRLTILRFADLAESEIATTIRPWVEARRSHRSTDESETQEVES